MLKQIIYVAFVYLVVELSVVLCSSGPVPVSIWKEGSKLESLAYNAEDDGKLTSNKFGKIMSNQLSKDKKVLVFLQDTLSLEDISEFGENSPYRKLASKAHEDNFVYFPAVYQPEKGLSHLKNWKKFDNLADDQGDIVKHLRKSEPVMVYVYLPKTDKEEFRTGTLERNDETMNRIIRAVVKAVGEVTVIFTGENPSVRVRREAPASRRLLAEEVKPKAQPAKEPLVSFNSSCLLLYVEKIALMEKNGSKEYLEKPEVKSTCANGSQTTVSLKWTGTSQGDLNLEIKFKGGSNKDWSVSSLQLNATGKGGNQQSSNTYKTKDLYAPRSFSYSCGGPIRFKPVHNATLKLDFENLQMQPLFGKASSKGFGRAYDCTGFFTVPILAGILVSLMFAVIMYWALSMVMSIQTMDQFDDPKGPSISVPQGD